MLSKQQKKQNKKKFKNPWVLVLSNVPNAPGHTSVVRLTLAGFLATTDANGRFTQAFAATTRAQLCTQWASYAARFTQFRVLGIKLTYEPDINVSFYDGTGGVTAVRTVGGMIVCTDRSGALTSPSGAGSETTAWAETSAKVFNVGKRWTYQAHAIDFEDQQYQAVTGTGNFYSVFVVGELLTASVTYGAVYEEYAVEFKGPR